jgi:hypothetical protein
MKTLVETLYVVEDIYVTIKAYSNGNMIFNIQNGFRNHLRQIDFRLQEVYIQGETNIHHPVNGGATYQLPSDVWEPGNAALWPITAFSPILTVWNSMGTYALTYFNDALVPVGAYWFSGPGAFNPFLRYKVDLLPGESITLTATAKVTTGGREAHWQAYRKTLAAFMEKLGVPEAVGKIKGTTISDDWSPYLATKLQRVVDSGIKSFIMWAPGDDYSELYNPYPPSLPWYKTFYKPEGLDVFGVLLNPNITPFILCDELFIKGGYTEMGSVRPYTNFYVNPMHPKNIAFVDSLLSDLESRGVNLAFWDMGNGPDHYKGMVWVSILLHARSKGIAFMCETSNDIAAWITGYYLEWPPDELSNTMIRAICPKASICTIVKGTWRPFS